MDIVVDTSALIAVIVDEPERDQIVDWTSGHDLIGPGSIPWEVGNAFSAMLKKQRLAAHEVQRGLEIFQSIPVRYLPINFTDALSIAREQDIYAYDAYFLECAVRHAAPLLTLDGALKRGARNLGIPLLES